MRVGAGAALTADLVQYSDYRSQSSNNNINPVSLAGNMVAGRFEILNKFTGETTLLSPGTYGRIGHASAENQVEWIVSGEGILTVLVPEVCYVTGLPEDKAVTFCL